MQEDLIQPFLSVQEAMEVAASLKLGDELKFSEKQLAVRQYTCIISAKDVFWPQWFHGPRRLENYDVEAYVFNLCSFCQCVHNILVFFGLN